MKKQKQKNTARKAFTLIELLVVIAIISLLASILLVANAKVKAKARDTQRIQNIKALLTALELYYSDNKGYPKTFDPGQALVAYRYCQGHEEDYIPNLAPTYLGKLPSDPLLNCNGQTHGWTYASDGIDFKLITHPEREISVPLFSDPASDGGGDPCVVDGSDVTHWGVWTYGGRCWAI